MIDETVKAAKTFLEEHPEEVRKYAHGRTFKEAGALIIAGFLGWPEHRIRYALERLGLIDDGIVEPEAKQIAIDCNDGKEWIDPQGRKTGDQ